MSRIIVIFLFSGSAFLVKGQSMPESEISFDILKWHFHHYPNSVHSGWKKGDHDTRIAFFQYQNDRYQVVYTTGGKRLVEEKDMIKEVPVSVSYYLDEKYTKYRIDEFVKVTDFTTDDIHYRLRVRSKENGDEVLNFDENLIPADFTLISKAD